jgi:hypothetical protein
MIIESELTVLCALDQHDSVAVSNRGITPAIKAGQWFKHDDERLEGFSKNKLLAEDIV